MNRLQQIEQELRDLEAQREELIRERKQLQKVITQFPGMESSEKIELFRCRSDVYPKL